MVGCLIKITAASEENDIVFLCHIFIFYPSIEDCLGFYLLSIVNRAAMTTAVQVSVVVGGAHWAYTSEWNSWVLMNLLLTFWEFFILFSTVVGSVSILPTVHYGHLFCASMPGLAIILCYFILIIIIHSMSIQFWFWFFSNLHLFYENTLHSLHINRAKIVNYYSKMCYYHEEYFLILRCHKQTSYTFKVV